MIGLIVLGVTLSIPYAQSQSGPRPVIASEADFRRAMKELSNWGRWGADGVIGKSTHFPLETGRDVPPDLEQQSIPVVRIRSRRGESAQGER
jgi:hypothetical protein